ncbi:MAG: hypothetical protein GKR88_04660 [Flavobacteriaceae bacterium]|nr:MAG: hypothetical protein GKR88_04660 [Flavobacteriaceae bacterium]
MKNLFFAVLMLFSLSTFASNEKENDAKITNDTSKDVTISSESNTSNDSSLCRVSCTGTISTGGVTITITVSAGNFLSSCERASRRCQEKLSDAMS